MAKVTIEPVSRVGRLGRTATFKVQVEGADASTIQVKPCDEAMGYRVAFPGGGIQETREKQEITMTVDLPSDAAMA